MYKDLVRKITFVVIMIMILSGSALTVIAKTSTNLKSVEQIVSCNLFSLSLPSSTKGKYKAETKGNKIYIYDKISEKAGFGGFAFGITAYKNQYDYAQLPSKKKLGELTDKNGTLYDIVLIQPTDVQFDYEKGECESYKLLYELAQTIDKTVQGQNGSKYFNGRGMHGKDLYGDILKKHRYAIKENFNSTRLELENMSYMYNVLASSGNNVSDITGYAYYDVNGDGIDELFIGEIAQGNMKGIIYDIYTIVDRKPTHVVSGGTRNRYFVCDNSFICNEYSGGANETGLSVYFLTENSTELFPQVSFIYNGYKNKNKPWFISYGTSQTELENVSEKTFNERKKIFEKYKRFDFIPFSK